MPESCYYPRNKALRSFQAMLCSLLFQSQVGYEWNAQLSNAVRVATKTGHYWSNYRIARSACRYGHHELSKDIFAVLKDRVSSEHFYFWLNSLEELSKGEAVLTGKDDLITRLSSSVTHYSKALASLKVLQLFQADFIRDGHESRINVAGCKYPLAGALLPSGVREGEVRVPAVPCPASSRRSCAVHVSSSCHRRRDRGQHAG